MAFDSFNPQGSYSDQRVPNPAMAGYNPQQSGYQSWAGMPQQSSYQLGGAGGYNNQYGGQLPGYNQRSYNDPYNRSYNPNSQVQAQSFNMNGGFQSAGTNPYNGPTSYPGYPSPGPYGSGSPQQPTYNSPDMSGWQAMYDKFAGHGLGDMNNDKNMAAQQIWLSNYGLPLLQAQQNMAQQSANNAQWGANFAEQQYLNKNQTALDWAASGREDAGLNYAIASGQQNFGEQQRQFDVTQGNQMTQFNAQNATNMYANQTERAQQEALAQYQHGQISLAQAQNQIEKARQEADARFQGGQLQNTEYANETDRQKVQNDLMISNAQNELVQQQNDIDSLYKQGLISVQQKDAMTNQAKVANDYKIGQLNAKNAADANAIQKLLGLKNIDSQNFANQTDRTKVANDYAIAQKQNQIDSLYKQGLIDVQTKEALTNKLKVENEFTMGTQQNQITQQLGLLNAQNQATANANQLLLGQGQLGQTAFGNQTERMQVQGQLGLGQGQLALDQMYKSGQLTNEQYQAQTARLQQQSQQSQWQQQLAMQQSQFGQNLQLQYAQMQQDAMNARLAAFGRVRAPNMAAYSQSWY